MERFLNFCVVSHMCTSYTNEYYLCKMDEENSLITDDYSVLESYIEPDGDDSEYDRFYNNLTNNQLNLSNSSPNYSFFVFKGRMLLSISTDTDEYLMMYLILQDEYEAYVAYFEFECNRVFRTLHYCSPDLDDCIVFLSITHNSYDVRNFCLETLGLEVKIHTPIIYNRSGEYTGPLMVKHYHKNVTMIYKLPYLLEYNAYKTDSGVWVLTAYSEDRYPVLNIWQLSNIIDVFLYIPRTEAEDIFRTCNYL